MTPGKTRTVAYGRHRLRAAAAISALGSQNLRAEARGIPSGHCTRGASLASASLDLAAAALSCSLRGTHIAGPQEMKDEKVKYLLQTAAVMAVLMVALAAALVYLAPAA